MTRSALSAYSLPVLVCLVMVIASLFVAVSAIASAGGEPYIDAASEHPAQDRAVSRIGSYSWDWQAFASDEGVVDVIIVLPESESVSSVMAKSAGMKGESDYSAIQSLAPTRTFSASINGFAASMTPEAISSFAFLVPGSVIYPDLPVQATLSKSVLKIGADQVWDQYDDLGTAVTGEGVVVAVIDTGIDYTHPDLGGGFGPAYKVIGGYDFLNKDSDPMDDNGHGTHVAGIIAANGDIQGVAPSARLLAYKVLGPDGSGSMSLVLSAIEAALDPNGDGLYNDRADVISMSLGGSGDPDDPVCVAVEEAIALGVVVVIAAGNEGPSLGTVASPGLAAGAITVGAADEYGVVANFSSRGPVGDLMMKPEVTAPGVQIVSTVPFANVKYSSPTGYMAMSGTSMATPHVSGAAALLVQMHPDWTPDMIKSALISTSIDGGESYWVGGAGEIWLPGSMSCAIFSSTPLVSYGLAGNPSVTFQVSNSGPSVGMTSDSDDWLSLTADGTQIAPVATSLSSVSPSYLSIASGGEGYFTIDVSGAVSSAPEGYYDGEVLLTSGSITHRISFGFVVLSKLNVHVYDTSGREIFDPYGGVLVYSIPDADIAIAKRGNIQPSPPASFMLPSGTYAIHALGHQLVYIYSNPYVLSTTADLGPIETLDVHLYMSQAHPMEIDLQTEGGEPIFVKDFRMYVRHEGTRNISFDLTGSDYSIVGSELFSISDSMTVYVSDTDAEVGIAISGFSYTSGMWEFMELNWGHWFEYASGLSTAFMFEASADLQYLLAWEFDGVDAGAPSALTWDDETTTTYVTAYDIPGTILNPWCNWGDHRSMGGDAAFFVRRDTDTSLNSFFSGMTRTTIVQGTFTELYYPRGLFEGFFERQYYSPDYDHMVRAGTVSEIFLPDRSFLNPLEPGTVVETIGAGPFYPSVRTENTDDSLVLFHPLLRDQSGARIGGKSGPSMSVYKNGALLGMYQLSEYLARPDAVRHVDLFGDGNYAASIRYYPSSQVFDDVLIELGFSVPSTDADPPQIVGMEMPQRFVPGDALPLSFQATDSGSAVTSSVSWRSSGSTVWNPLVVEGQSGSFATSIPTSPASVGVDVRIEVTDISGNYLRYTANHASLAEVPVVFELSALSDEVKYRDSPVTVVLEGQLTDSSGNPLSSVAGVLLELTVSGEKVGMLLDEYIVGTTHTHNGDIRFEWSIIPTHLFSSVGQTIEVLVEFDLGVYEPISRSFTLTSALDAAVAPVVTLNSPGHGALFAPGEIIDLTIEDDGVFSATVSIDGAAYQDLLAPWDISTSNWGDGAHTVNVRVTDDEGMIALAAYEFEVDGTSPELEVVRPVDGAQVPIGFSIQLDVYDAHLSSVAYTRDGGVSIELGSPYSIDMTTWEVGEHTVQFQALDALDHMSSASIQFEIVNSTITAVVVDPAFGAVIQSGAMIDVDVYTTGTPECIWTEDGVQHALPQPYDIDTTDWSEGLHVISVVASDDLGGAFEIDFEVVVDDTLPVISLVTPALGSYVTPDSFITVRAMDDYLQAVSWLVFGISSSSESATSTISVGFITTEGQFSVVVTAVDLAGNSAQEGFVFIMDLKAPEVGIAGIASGDAILPGTALTLFADDTYISSFAWSLDGEPFVQTSAPTECSTDGLSAGWHQVTMVAEDCAGRVTEGVIAFYIDDSPPSVILEDEYEVKYGSVLVIRAVAADDFGIGGGVLFYESSNGEFLSIGMALDGAELEATVDSDDLWNQMTIYVVVEDEAGNTAESAMAAVTVIPSSAASPDPDGVDDGSEQAGSPISAIQLALSAGIVVAALLILVLTANRRRRSASTLSVAGMVVGSSVASTLMTAKTGRVRTARTRPTAMCSEISTVMPVTNAVTNFEDGVTMHHVTFAGAGPEGAVMGSARDCEDQPDEYDEVERQLLSIISRGSVYTDVELADDAVIDDDDRYRGPTVVSGLELARKMRREPVMNRDAS